MHDHIHQYNNMGEQRIRTFPASITSLPHTSFLGHHSSCITGKCREAMENVPKTDGQNMMTIKLFPVEAFSSNSIVLNAGSTSQQFK